jgi:hypothetical protein
VTTTSGGRRSRREDARLYADVLTYSPRSQTKFSGYGVLKSGGVNNLARAWVEEKIT